MQYLVKLHQSSYFTIQERVSIPLFLVIVLPVSLFASVEVIVNKSVNDITEDDFEFTRPILMVAATFTGKALYSRLVKMDVDFEEYQSKPGLLQYFWIVLNVLAYYALMFSYVYIPASIISMVSFTELSILRFYILGSKHGFWHPKVVSYYFEGIGLTVTGCVLITWLALITNTLLVEETIIGLILLGIYLVLKSFK